jgi:hypothetical protein
MTTFSLGGHYRIEIPSVEGPGPLRAVLEEARQRSVTLHRASQGSGIMLQTREEIREMCRLGAEHRVEVCLFVGPRTAFDTSAMFRAPGGATMGWQVRGARLLDAAMDELKYACDLGLRSVLVADLGQIDLIREARSSGVLPRSLVVKASASLAPCNPATVRVLERLGADSINVASDLDAAELGAMRTAITAVLDLYIEAPDSHGGFVRYYDAPDIVRAAAPIYLKLGLRNAADVYPSGIHLEDTAVRNAREKVRRAQILIEHLRRLAPELRLDPPGAAEGVPEF